MKLLNNFYVQRLNSRIIDKNFTIISNNCWGTALYHELGLTYNTPFVGLYIPGPCYIKLLKNLKSYLSQELTFIKISRYQDMDPTVPKIGFPIGILGDDIELHFMHYKTSQEAREKWLRRIDRINWDNLFIKFCDRGSCTVELLEEFEKLDFPRKICFTCKAYAGFNSTVWIKECAGGPSVMDGEKLYRVCRKYFDIADWLNGGSGRLNFIQEILNRIIYF